MAKKNRQDAPEEIRLTKTHDGRWITPDGDLVELPQKDKPPKGTAVRHRVSGDLGLRFSRDGKDYVRYDRPGQELIRQWSDAEWESLDYERTLAPIHLAMVCFAADAELAKSLAENSKKEWGFLSQSEKEIWCQAVTSGNTSLTGPRKVLFLGMREAMRPLLGSD